MMTSSGKRPFFVIMNQLRPFSFWVQNLISTFMKPGNIDICVVLLNEPVDLNERVQPIGLSRIDENLFGDDFNKNTYSL